MNKEQINERLTDLYSNIECEVGSSTMDLINEIVKLEIELALKTTKKL